MTTYLRHYHVLLGLLLIGLGIWTFINPEILRYYGVDLVDPEARIAVRAIIGGGEVGLGLLLTVGTFGAFTNKALNSMAATVFLSVGLARVFAILIEQGSAVGWQPWRESSIELLLGTIALFAAQRPDVAKLRTTAE